MNSIDIFPWDDNFNTGIVVIDEQHKMLVQLLNRLASHIAFKTNSLELNKIFDELAEYTIYHFKTEEAIWHKHLHSDSTERSHIEIHKKFISEVMRLKASQSDNSIEKVAEDVLAFLAKWLASHILESDRYMAYLMQALDLGNDLEKAKIIANEKMSGATKVLIQIILGIYESLSSNTLHLMRELADKKRSEKELLDAKLRAETANMAKSRFLANMSHEIRTPLNGILGMAQLLNQQNLSDTERTAYIQTIINSGDNLLKMLSDVLDMSKIEAGNFALEYKICDVQKIINEVGQNCSNAALKKNLKLEINTTGIQLINYQLDDVRIKQMLNYFLSNAIKFTECGFILIEGKEVQRNDTFAILEFSVTDSGIGISEKHLTHLFQPFYQVDDSTTRRHQGTGLGLSIVRSFAEFMGGSVGVQTALGKGSRFWFTVKTKTIS